MNGNMKLLGDVLLVVFTFFGVVPVLLNTVSQFTVLKRFSEEMVREGVIEEQKVRDLLPKKQIAGVVISALMLFVLFSVCLKTAPYGWLCAGIPFVLGLFKYRTNTAASSSSTALPSSGFRITSRANTTPKS